MRTATSCIPNDQGLVFLTFDDGPEPEITEFVLNELKKYKFKATFFCIGEKVEKYPDLVKRILDDGHSIGNHTYSHAKAYDINGVEFVNDVNKADNIIHSFYFRPPNGCLTLSSWIRLRKKYKIIYWSIGSGDWLKETFDYEKSMNGLKRTKSGDIILFHFSKELEKGSQLLLPDYLRWLRLNNYISNSI